MPTATCDIFEEGGGEGGGAEMLNVTLTILWKFTGGLWF